MIIATCGHQLTEAEELGKTIAIKALSREGEHAVEYPTICDKCFERYQAAGAILTEQQADEWLDL